MTCDKKLSEIIVIYMITMGLFSRITELFYIWKIGFLILFVSWCFCRSSREKIGLLFRNPYLIGVLFCMLGSILLAEDSTYLLYNLKLILWPMLFLVTIVSIYLGMPEDIGNLMRKLFLPLNAMLLVNLIVTAIQCMGFPLFIRESWRALNPFYPDLCCGLFGLNGTHELSMFLLFMFIYNLDYAKDKENKTPYYVYTMICAVVIACISTMNDNIAMFVLMPAIFFMYFIMCELFANGWKNALISWVKKYGLFFCVLLFTILMIPATRDFINEYVIIRLKMVFNVNSEIYQINGSNERLAIVLDALSSSSGWLFGKGIGSASYGGGDFWGYAHFGLSSIGAFIMTGGIWFYLFYTLYFANAFSLLIGSKRNAKVIFMISALLIVVYSIYTIIYTSFVTTIWVILLFIILGIANHRETEKRIQ